MLLPLKPGLPPGNPTVNKTLDAHDPANVTVILAVVAGPGKVLVTGPVNEPFPRFNEPPVTATEPLTLLPFTSTVVSEMFKFHTPPPSGPGTVVLHAPGTGNGDVR